MFDHFIADTATRELLADGQAVPVEPKVFDLLSYLIANNDRVVPKDELVDEIWDGRFISDAAVSSALAAARRALGDDGQGQKFLKTVRGRGIRFVAPVTQALGEAQKCSTAPPQEIRMCRSNDGTRIAYAEAGEGPTLVKASNWLTHLEHDWESPVWRHFYSALTNERRLVRYDSRGNGLSDRDVSDHSFDRQVEDLEAVVDAAGGNRFSLLGLCQGCTSAVAYAAKYPDKVDRLILIGGYVKGWRARGDTEGYVLRKSAHEALPIWWGKDTTALRDLFTGIYMPDAPSESQRWFSDLQRKTASPDSAAAMMFSDCDDDISDLLEKVRAPTLVIHAVGDLAAPFEQGQELAAGIDGARFVSLDTVNHILPEGDPEWPRASALINEFLTAGT